MIAGMAMRLHHLITDVESYSLTPDASASWLPLARAASTPRTPKSVTVTLPTNKGVIASRLNLTQEHFRGFCMSFRTRADHGRGRKIHIPDVEKLRDYDLDPANQSQRPT